MATVVYEVDEEIGLDPTNVAEDTFTQELGVSYVDIEETLESDNNQPAVKEERIFAFIVNPQSGTSQIQIIYIKKYFLISFCTLGAGKGGSFSDALRDRLVNNFTRKNMEWHIYFTEASGDGIKLAQLAIAEGYNYIVSVGGDGTHNEVMNGIISYENSVPPEKQKKVVMGVIPLGTGGDFQRTLGTCSFTPDNYIEMLYNPKKYKSKPQLIDVGHISCTPLRSDNRPNTMNERYFLNISSCGVSAAVCHGANTSSKKLGGFTTFFYQTCKRLCCLF